jgi:hypothetical protein
LFVILFYFPATEYYFLFGTSCYSFSYCFVFTLLNQSIAYYYGAESSIIYFIFLILPFVLTFAIFFAVLPIAYYSWHLLFYPDSIIHGILLSLFIQSLTLKSLLHEIWEQSIDSLGED